MTIQACEHNDIFLVPLDGETLADAFANTDIVNSDYAISYNADGNAMIRDGKILVVEVMSDVLGGCLVRVGAVLDQMFSLSTLVEEAADEKIARAMDYVLQLGGMEAVKSKGKWRPVDDIQRTSWIAHMARANGQNMRVKALNDNLQNQRAA